MTEEIWKDIKGYEGLYQISSFGRVKSLNKKIIMKTCITNKGYLQILLGNKKKKHYLVHRLVAQAFLPNPDNLPQVNHKDENKQNNNVLNLEWCDNKYNNNYGTHKEREIKTKRRKRIIKHYIFQQMKYLQTLKDYKEKLLKLVS